MEIKELINQAKQHRKTSLGHVSFARETLRAIKKEIGPEEYNSLGPSAAFYVVCKLLEQRLPDLYEKVMTQVGKSLYRSEVGQLFYKIRDEK